MVDTSLYPPAYQQQLLTLLTEEIDLDEHTDGVLIHSDNFQALNLLQARYREQVKCIYIDPPYNTEDDRAKGKFIYKDGYPSSTWASLVSSRLELAKPLLNETGVIFQSIDDNEHSRLKILTDEIFGGKNYLTSFIRKTKSMTGDDSNGLNIQHEYLITHGKNKDILKFFGEEKTLEGYSNPDNDPNGNWCSGDPSAKSGGVSTYFPIKNPFTGKEDYPPQGRFWAFSQETMQEYIRIGRIKFKENYNPKHRGFIFKRYANNLASNFMPVGTLFSAENRYMNSVATTEIKYYFQSSENFDYPKPEVFINNLVKYSTNKSALILDYFAGSGTTVHAVINLNREDGGNRKYILVEQGEYFDTVLKPRVQKVIYSENWKDGKPMPSEKQSDGFNGVSQIVKVLKLESYEDTLNNIALKPQDDLFKQLPENVQEDYLLRYLLDVESKGSLLNSDDFQHPFDYRLNIATDSAGAYQSTVIDLPETFNYLLGIRVQQITDEREKRGYLTIEGLLPNDARCLIVWRDCEKMGYTEVAQFFDKHNINPNSNQYDVIYLNGDHDMANQWQNEDGSESRLALRALEPEFLNRMFMEKGE